MGSGSCLVHMILNVRITDQGNGLDLKRHSLGLRLGLGHGKAFFKEFVVRLPKGNEAAKGTTRTTWRPRCAWSTGIYEASDRSNNDDSNE